MIQHSRKMKQQKYFATNKIYIVWLMGVFMFDLEATDLLEQLIAPGKS